jgi:transcriptional regulator with XRE-family HTH domain
METLTTHWTNDSIDDFLHKIASDFVLQIENYIDSSGGTQDALAKKLNVTPGRVSQVLNKPGNLSLRKIVEYARALNKKVAIVAYDDNDPENASGPINSQVFERCWQRAGRPSDFFALQEAETIHNGIDLVR